MQMSRICLRSLTGLLKFCQGQEVTIYSNTATPLLSYFKVSSLALKQTWIQEIEINLQ